ncbi:MAG: HDOD domain-containing protein [Deltaproteobacteria bacterium]|nr:HDOD domain-containing protein [Deltaproteobacteria bacterium]
MTNMHIQKIIEQIKDLPPLPAAVQKLGVMAHDPATEVKDISRVISSDTALTGRILRVANSAFYGPTPLLFQITKCQR